jgi:Amt family ammonium transporter
VLGKRITHKPGEDVEPHDIPMVVLGCALLWFGWFGFNAGSALAANGLATSAFLNTNTAAAMAALTWLTISWAHKGQPSVVGATAGAVAGLVAITPAAGYVTPGASIIIGLLVSVVCYGAVMLRDRMKVDDALDVWAVHGVGGTVGAICTGLFATTVINSGAANGALYGNVAQLWIQIVAVTAAWVFSGVMTFVILKVVNVFVPLRVSEKEEAMGLDLSQHSEVAYSPS